MFKKIIIVLGLISIIACSSHVSKESKSLYSGKKYAVGSFWNYTETSMAGLRAASIVEGVLAKEKVTIFSIIDGDEEFSLSKDKKSVIELQFKKAKKLGANYLITGEVQEWRYKTGIDGEPVVSYTLKIFDVETKQVVFSALGAKSAWGHKSIGTVAQEIASDMLPKFIN